MSTQTFLIVENNALYRKILRRLIESQTGWSVAAEAADLKEVMLYLAHGSPDVIVVDIDLPETNGIEAIRCILQQDPKACIIAVSDFPDEEFRRAGLNAGALHYILKEDLDVPRLAQLLASCPAISRHSPCSEGRLPDR